MVRVSPNLYVHKIAPVIAFYLFIWTENNNHLGRWNLWECTNRHGQNGGCGKCRSGYIGMMWQGWTMREWKYRHHVVGVVNAGVDLSARYGKGGGQYGK